MQQARSIGPIPAPPGDAGSGARLAVPASAEAGGRRFRPGLLPTLMAGIGVAILVALGCWQVHRLRWKEDLIARAEAGLQLAPLPLPVEADWPSLDFRPLEATGVLDRAAGMGVGSAAVDGVFGGELVMPLQLGGGRWLLVDLGWLPEERLRARTTGEGLPSAPLTVRGVARYRAQIRPGWFTPSPDQAARRWYDWDLAGMGAVLGRPLLPIVLVREAPTLGPGEPLPQPVVVDYRNDHLGYAITWFGLAAALAAVYVAFGLRRGGA